MRRERYCASCRKAILREMDDAGYLAPRLAPSGCKRASTAMENENETLRGVGPWQENAVRALEDA